MNQSNKVQGKQQTRRQAFATTALLSTRLSTINWPVNTLRHDCDNPHHHIHTIASTPSNHPLTAHVGVLVTAVPTVVVKVAHPALPQTASVLADKLVLGAGVVLGHTHLAVVADDEVTALVAGTLHLVVGGGVAALAAAAIVVGAQVVVAWSMRQQKTAWSMEQQKQLGQRDSRNSLVNGTAKTAWSKGQQKQLGQRDSKNSLVHGTAKTAWSMGQQKQLGQRDSKNSLVNGAAKTAWSKGQQKQLGQTQRDSKNSLVHGTAKTPCFFSIVTENGPSFFSYWSCKLVSSPKYRIRHVIFSS